jgi:chromosome segregation ATPase
MSVPEISRKVKQDDDVHLSLVARLQRRLGDLSSQQEKLEEIREQLLIDREATALGRKAIGQQRYRTADSEIAFLDALRKHFSDLGRPLPDDLLLAYEKVEKHHLQLRHLENEHLQIEESLGTAEWDFIDMEREFYHYRLTELLSEGRTSKRRWRKHLRSISQLISYHRHLVFNIVPQLLSTIDW